MSLLSESTLVTSVEATQAVPSVREIPLEEIEEAYQWHDLFTSGYITAHELKYLGAEEKPEFEGELFKVETQHLLAIKRIIDLDLPDEEFSQQLETMEALLPRPFIEMKGMEQTMPHGDIDPTEHTLNALRNLDTEGLTSQERMIVRIALIFHDVGKVLDPIDREHPRRSVELAEDYLIKMGLTSTEVSRILNHIKWHDALGDATRKDGRNIFHPHDAIVFFPSELELHLHKKIALADVSSIPGLRHHLPQLEATYADLVSELRTSLSRITVQLENQLPFPPVVEGSLGNLKRKIVERKDFDTVDLEADIASRRAKYAALEPDKQEYIEQLTVQSAVTNKGILLECLKCMGRETDLDLIKELETKYNRDLYNLRIATHTFRMTYELWQLKNLLVKVYSQEPPKNLDLIRAKVKAVIAEAKELAGYRVVATHFTQSDFEEKIDSSLALVKSRVDNGESHYEGAGVYVGILGSYDDWSKDSFYTFIVALADTLPIIVNFNDPKIMANVLGDMVDIEAGIDDIAISHGAIQWLQTSYPESSLQKWKIKLIQEVLNAPLRIVTATDGSSCLVIDTEEPPIVWAAVARALQIPRLIPLQYLRFATDLKRYDVVENFDRPQPEEIDDPSEERLFSRVRKLFSRQRAEDLFE